MQSRPYPWAITIYLFMHFASNRWQTLGNTLVQCAEAKAGDIPLKAGQISSSVMKRRGSGDR